MNYFDGWADPVSSFHYDGLVRSGVNGQFSQYRPLSGWRDNTLASMRVSLRTGQYGLQSHGRTWDRTRDLPRVKREQRLRLASPNRSFGLEGGSTAVRATG